MAQNTDFTKVITIELDDSELLGKLREVNSALEVNQAAQRALNNQRKQGAVDNDIYIDSVNRLKIEEKALKNAQSQVNKEAQNTIAKNKAAEGSYNKMQAQLRELVAQYKAMSAAQRDGADGAALLKNIAQTTDELKKLDKGMGVFNRNVGNYQDAFSSDAFGKLAQTVAGLSPTFAQSAQAAVSAGNKIGVVFKTGPLLIVSAVASAIMTVVRAFKSSETATMNLKVAFAPLVGMWNTFANVLQQVAVRVSEVMANLGGKALNVIQRVAGWVDKAFGTETQEKVDSFTRKVADNATAMAAIAERENKLTKDTRANIIASAEDELRISELRYKAQRKDLYTAEQRLAFIKEASALQLQRAKEEKRLAEEAVAIQAEKMKQTENSTDDENKLAELRAAAIRAEKTYFDQQREMSEKIVSFTREIEAERKAAHEDEKKRIEELAALQRRVQSATIAMMQDGYEKEVAMAQNAGEQKIEALNKELAEGKLTAEAYMTLRTQIEQETAAAVTKAREKSAKTEFEKRVAEREAQFQAERLMAQKNGASLAEVELSQAQRLYDELANAREQMAQYGYETEQEYDNALLELELSIAEKRKQIAEDTAEAKARALQDEIATTNAYLGAASKLTGALVSLTKEQAESDERYATFAKGLAVFQIALDTATAIASTVTEAAKLGWPAMIPAIISGAAAVVSGMVSAKQALSEAGTAPKYHTGGLVEGNGEVNAVLLDGESVMTRAATANFGGLLSELNVASGGNAITAHADTSLGDSYIAAMFRKALDDMPAPVVSVVEITKAQKQVSAIRTRARR